MPWYISYRNGKSVVMNVFKSKDLAIGAARHLLEIRCDNEIKVGPMLEPIEGNILNADGLRQLDRGE
jgi:hypothetical protein